MHGNLVSNVYFVASFNDSKAEKVPKKPGFALNKNKMKKKNLKKPKTGMNPLFIGIHSLSVRYGCLYLRRSLDLINHRLLNQCNICFNCKSILLKQILVSI